ncbi:MAG: leucine-rich repeat protein [Clostridia bacterium]|nr:leucine-rich repeat protein [Clostridia bacterium]
MNKILRKILASLLTVVIIITAAPLSGFVGLELPDFGAIFSTKAEAAAYSGTCGENLTWTLDTSTGALVISGVGNMLYDYQWSSYKDKVVSVIIKEGVTSIGTDAFYDYDSITNVSISDSVTDIFENAFMDCDSLQSVQMGNGVIYIHIGAFNSCDSLTEVNFNNKLKTIGQYAFTDCTSLEKVYITENVSKIGYNAFSGCESLKSIDVNEANQYYSSDASGVLFNKGKTLLIQYPAGNLRTHYSIPIGVEEIRAFSIIAPNLISVTIPSSLAYVYDYGFFESANLTDVYFLGSFKEWENIEISESGNESLLNAAIHFKGIYNLGEETYCFDNFSDADSDGHCFGMSITSSGYYFSELNVSGIDINDSSELYTVSKTSTVKKPICYYHSKQGSYSLKSTVAGGTYYKYRYYDIESDWEEVVDYVENHNYDNTGALQIGFRKGKGGHAINFLRYEKVNGQDRIYAYDNNFPDVETYFCKEADGKIYQKPYSTFSGAIDCIALRDILTYYSEVKDFDDSRVIYAQEYMVKIEDIPAYPMDLGLLSAEYIMYEIPEGVTKIKIIPLTDNATFEYMGKTYQFGNVTESVYGLLTLSNAEEGTTGSIDFTIVLESGKVNSVSIDNIEMNYKDSTAITPTIDIDEGVEYTVTYSSSDNSVAQVDENGNTYASGKGEATITCTVTDEYGNTVTDTCDIEVKYTWWQWIIVIVLFGWIWY